MADREISKLSVLLLFDTSKFERGLSDSQKLMQRVGRGMTDVGKKLSLGVSLPLGIIGKRVADTATEFEYQMARVQAISGATSSSFNSLKANAEALGASTIFTATSVAQLQEEFAKLGFTANEITQVTESTLSLAQVTGADLPRAAEIAGATLRTFNMQADQVGQVNDVVAVAISKSALDFESFAETMKYAGSQAAISGISMEELSAAMGVLANRGVKGSIAGTRLRMIFAKLAEEGGNVHDNFLDLINGNISMTEAIDRFGVRAATAIPVLQENREEFYQLEKAMRHSAGSLEIMQETMDDTSFAAQKKLKSALENLSIQLGKSLLPVVNAVADMLVVVTNLFAGMPRLLREATVFFGSLAVAIGPLLFGLGNLLTMFPALSALLPGVASAISFLLGPWGLLIAAVGALGLAYLAGQKPQMEFMRGAERIQRATQSAQDATVQATAKIRELIHAYANENRTLEEKQDILKKLQQLQPDYFSDLDAENTAVNDLKASYDKLYEAMLRQARAKAFMEEMNRLEQERVDALLRQDEIRQELVTAGENEATQAAASQSASTTTTGLVRDFQYAGSGQLATASAASTLVDDLESEMSDLDQVLDSIGTQQQKLREIMEEGGLNELLGSQATPQEDTVSAVTTEQDKVMQKLANSLRVVDLRQEHLGITAEKVAKEKLRAFNTAMKELVEAAAEGEDVGNALDYVKDRAADLAATAEALDKDVDLQNVFKKMKAAVEAAGTALEAGGVSPLKAAKAEMAAVKTALDTMNEKFSDQVFIIALLQKEYDKLVGKVETLTRAQEKQNLESKITESVNMAIIRSSLQIGEALGAIGDKSKEAGRAMLEAVTSTLAALITQIYLLYAKEVMTDKMTPSALGKLAMLGAGAGVIAGFINSIPKLAEGGIASGEQLAVVGDNRSGKEAIIPLEKLPGLMAQMGGMGGTRVYGHLDGYDIALSSDRSGKRFQRISR